MSRAIERSLAAHVAAWTALALAASMAVYGAYQYATTPEASVTTLLIEHIVHVVVLGLVVYGVLWIGLKRVVVLPAHQVATHLYRVGTGQVEQLEATSRVREMQHLVSAVNLMIRRMEIRRDDRAIERMWTDIDVLVSIATRLSEAHPGASGELLASAARIEKTILGLVPRPAEIARESTRPNAPDGLAAH